MKKRTLKLNRKRGDVSKEVNIAWAVGFRAGIDEGAAQWKQAYEKEVHTKNSAIQRLANAKKEIGRLQKRVRDLHDRNQRLHKELAKAMKESGKPHEQILTHEDIKEQFSYALAQETDRNMLELAEQQRQAQEAIRNPRPNGIIPVDNSGAIIGIDFAADSDASWENLRRYAEEDPPEGNIDMSSIRPSGDPLSEALMRHPVAQAEAATREASERAGHSFSFLCLCSSCENLRASFRQHNSDINRAAAEIEAEENREIASELHHTPENPDEGRWIRADDGDYRYVQPQERGTEIDQCQCAECRFGRETDRAADELEEDEEEAARQDVFEATGSEIVLMLDRVLRGDLCREVRGEEPGEEHDHDCPCGCRP